MHRRDFLSAATALAGAASAEWLFAEESSPASPSNAGRIFKSVKWGMIKTDGPPRARFELCRQLGFDGMELISPGGPAAEEVREASKATGMPVHGLVNMRHWKVRLSSPDADTREKGRQFLEQAIRDARDYGGDSVLLVPGRVSGADETHEHVWNRSIDQIRRVLPLASRLGVRVLIENVWNGFCNSPELLRDYVDELSSPWVGVYFDIGNAQKFAPSEHWIRTLGPRIVKLDVKGWGKQTRFGKIGDGDIDWPAVRQALAEIGFTGWCTAEVAGGGLPRLREVATRMDQVLDL